MSDFKQIKCKKKYSWVGPNPEKINKKNAQLYQKKKTDKNIIINNNYRNEENILLSNANLNIINILNTCMSRESSFRQHHYYKSKNNDKTKKSMSKSTKTAKNKESEIKQSKNKNSNTNSSIFYLTGNDSFINSNISNYMKVYKEKETMIEGKVISKREKKSEDNHNIRLGRRSVNINTISDYNKLMDKTIIKNTKSKSNKKIKNMTIERILGNDSSNKNSHKTNSDDSSIYKNLSDIEMLKINENIHNEINLMNLKKKITKLKKRIQRFSNKSLKKYDKKEKEIVSPKKCKSTVSEKKKSNKEVVNKKIYKSKSNVIKKPTISEIKKANEINDRKQEKYRKLKHKKCVYDSIDDEEYDDEVIDFYLAPNSLYLIIMDTLIFLSSIFYFTFLPYLLSTNYFFFKDNNKIYKYIFLIIDIIYIIDLINNFFRAFHTFDEHLIRRTKKIIMHYIKTWFLIDLVQAIPYYSIFYFLRSTTEFNHYAENNQIIYIVLIIKIIKVYKLFNDNSTLSSFAEIVTKYEWLDEHGSMVVTVLILLFCINLTTCIFIFLGTNSYPNWMTKINIQDEPFLSIYLIALYFIIVTVTTVGYGDIAGNSISEIIFQILLLIVGTISYSFIISYISNYIVKSNQKSMSYEKNIEILQEIKFNNPKMKDSIYKEVLRTLHNEQIYERKDKHLLFDCLSYSLKNELIIEMYKPLIMNFIFFKDVYNSDFFIKVATSLKSLISIKGNILIQEGDFVKEIFFIKNGVVGLSISIDINNLEELIKKYFDETEKVKNDRKFLSAISKKRNSVFSYKSNIKTFFTNHNSDMDSNTGDHQDPFCIEKSIVDIRKNEHFGDALMFLNERSPLIAKVKTRTAELLILRKMEAIEIYSIYPNVWKRINKKSLYNMEQIYQKIKKIIIDLSNRYNIKVAKYLNKDTNIINNNNREKIVTFSLDNKNKKRNSKRKSEKTESQIQKNKSQIKNKENDNNFIEKVKILENNFVKSSKSINSEANNQRLFVNFNNNLNNTKSFNDVTFKGDDQNNNESGLSKSESSNLSSIIVKTNNFKIIDEEELKKKATKKNNFLELSSRQDSYRQNENHQSLTRRKNSKYSNKINEAAFTKSINASFNSLNNNNNMFMRKSIQSKNENLYYNAFINLNSTKENSFQLKASYENIHSISNNKYINNTTFQHKVKQFVMKESIDDNQLGFHNTSHSIILTPSQNNELQRLNTIKFDGEHKSFKLGLLKQSQSIKKYKTRRSKNDNIFEASQRSRSITSQDILPNKIKYFKTIKSSARDSTFIGHTNKIKRKLTKKKLLNVNKKLVTIRQNIQNTNYAINNPMEFYMNFFNDIIKKESSSKNYKEEEQQKEFELSCGSLSST